jgi:adenylosuccinate synthase
MSVTALVGAQYGSEGKGAVAAAIARDFDVHIRTGGPNAGHTVYHDGKKWAMRSVPCGWVAANSHLVIGPGALIDVSLLIEEVEALQAAGYDVASRLWVDKKAAVIDPIRHHRYEGGVDGYAHEKIGSTGEGVGPARMARIARGTFRDEAWAKLDFASDYAEDISSLGAKVTDTAASVNRWLDMGARVLLEGTQGSGLSLIHGPWPYVTSHDTNAAQLLVDAGLAPGSFSRTLLVARTFPIRVAGNSGPLAAEVSWDEIGVPPEHTTVTGKERRIGEWDLALVKQAYALNRPASLALTFLDYWFPETAGITEWAILDRDIQTRVLEIEKEIGCPITIVGTGPDSVIRRRER